MQEGQSLNHIAHSYGVTVGSLAAANELNPDAPVRPGQVLQVPDKGVVYVNAGQTLWSVARRHDCTVEALARVNGISTSASLRPGMRLVLPGHTPGAAAKKSRDAQGRSERGADSEPDTGRYRPSGRGGNRVELFRVATGQHLTLALTDRKGRVKPEASRQLARFLRPRNAKKIKLPNPRLVSLLAQISDHYGGKPIHVVSGYRVAKGYTKQESRHVAGAAIDFRVEGVPPRTLRDYLRHFDDVGVGYYPNSTFVHFDVRSKNAYWVDLSSPGQRPAYVPREEREGFGNRTDGLAELGQSLGAAFGEMEHGEPDATAADDE